MAEPQTRFIDGDTYERSMGVWSRLAGEIFLDWLGTSPGLRWVDVGCGSGVFTDTARILMTIHAVECGSPSAARAGFV